MPHLSRFEMSSASNVARSPTTITPGTSPYVYTAPANGVLFISGGTLSAITYTRGISVTALGLGSSSIPVSQGDQITVTWAISAPTLTFLPS